MSARRDAAQVGQPAAAARETQAPASNRWLPRHLIVAKVNKREGWVASQRQQACRDPCPTGVLTNHFGGPPPASLSIRGFDTPVPAVWARGSSKDPSSCQKGSWVRHGCQREEPPAQQFLFFTVYSYFPRRSHQVRIHIQLLLFVLKANAAIPRPTNVH